MRDVSFDTDNDCSTSFQGLQSKTLALFTSLPGVVSHEKHPDVSSNGYMRNARIRTLGKPPGAENAEVYGEVEVISLFLQHFLEKL